MNLYISIGIFGAGLFFVYLYFKRVRDNGHTPAKDIVSLLALSLALVSYSWMLLLSEAWLILGIVFLMAAIFCGIIIGLLGKERGFLATALALFNASIMFYSLHWTAPLIMDNKLSNTK